METGCSVMLALRDIYRVIGIGLFSRGTFCDWRASVFSFLWKGRWVSTWQRRRSSDWRGGHGCTGISSARRVWAAGEDVRNFSDGNRVAHWSTWRCFSGLDISREGNDRVRTGHSSLQKLPSQEVSPSMAGLTWAHLHGLPIPSLPVGSEMELSLALQRVPALQLLESWWQWMMSWGILRWPSQSPGSVQSKDQYFNPRVLRWYWELTRIWREFEEQNWRYKHIILNLRMRSAVPRTITP